MTEPAAAPPRRRSLLLPVSWAAMITLALVVLFRQLLPAIDDFESARDETQRERAHKERLQEEAERAYRGLRSLREEDPVAIRRALQKEGYVGEGAQRVVVRPAPSGR